MSRPIDGPVPPAAAAVAPPDPRPPLRPPPPAAPTTLPCATASAPGPWMANPAAFLILLTAGCEYAHTVKTTPRIRPGCLAALPRPCVVPQLLLAPVSRAGPDTAGRYTLRQESCVRAKLQGDAHSCRVPATDESVRASACDVLCKVVCCITHRRSCCLCDFCLHESVLLDPLVVLLVPPVVVQEVVPAGLPPAWRHAGEDTQVNGARRASRGGAVSAAASRPLQTGLAPAEPRTTGGIGVCKMCYSGCEGWSSRQDVLNRRT